MQKTLRIKRVVDIYFERTNSTKVEAKELMQDFIANGIFDHNNKDGSPIRDFLRKLDDEKHLHLLPQAFFEQKAINKNWFFIKSVK